MNNIVRYVVLDSRFNNKVVAKAESLLEAIVTAGRLRHKSGANRYCFTIRQRKGWNGRRHR